MIDIESLPQEFQNAVRDIGPTINVPAPNMPQIPTPPEAGTAKLANIISHADENLKSLIQAIDILKSHDQHEFIKFLCRKALERSSGHPAVHKLLAIEYIRNENLYEAIECLKEIARIVPETEETLELRIETYNQITIQAMIAGEDNDVIWAFEQLESLQKLEAEDFSNWANALKRLGQKSEAENKCIDAITLDKNYPLAYITLAEMAIESGDLDAAHRHIQLAKTAGNHEQWNEETQQIIKTAITKVKAIYEAAKPTGHNFG